MIGKGWLKDEELTSIKSWAPEENVVLSLQDQTGEKRSEKDLDELAEKVNEAVEYAGFRIDSYGSENSYYLMFKQRIINKLGHAFSSLIGNRLWAGKFDCYGRDDK